MRVMLTTDMIKVTTHEAKTQLSKLIARAQRGEEIVICRGDRPAAKLVATEGAERAARPRVGTKTSAPVQMAEDAFAPLTDAELERWGL